MSSANPIYLPIPGAPFAPGDRVRVVDIIDGTVDERVVVGLSGTVVYQEYECGCGQTYPGDPMIGVKLDGFDPDILQTEFWKEELCLIL